MEARRGQLHIRGLVCDRILLLSIQKLLYAVWESVTINGRICYYSQQILCMVFRMNSNENLLCA